jgi:hypothetical protein
MKQGHASEQTQTSCKHVGNSTDPGVLRLNKLFFNSKSICHRFDPLLRRNVQIDILFNLLEEPCFYLFNVPVHLNLAFKLPRVCFSQQHGIASHVWILTCSLNQILSFNVCHFDMAACFIRLEASTRAD